MEQYINYDPFVEAKKLIDFENEIFNKYYNEYGIFSEVLFYEWVIPVFYSHCLTGRIDEFDYEKFQSSPNGIKYLIECEQLLQKVDFEYIFNNESEYFYSKRRKGVLDLKKKYQFESNQEFDKYFRIEHILPLKEKVEYLITDIKYSIATSQPSKQKPLTKTPRGTKNFNNKFSADELGIIFKALMNGGVLAPNQTQLFPLLEPFIGYKASTLMKSYQSAPQQAKISEKQILGRLETLIRNLYKET